MASSKKTQSLPESSGKTFSAFANLDTRILRALADQSFIKPTLVQEKAIPVALEGRDVLCRARTGSGKTVAYCVPVLERVLAGRKASSNDEEKQSTRAVILVPTRELSEQVTTQLKKLSKYCEDIIVSNVTSGGNAHRNKMLGDDRPDVVVGTPARVLALAQSKTLSLHALEILVIDEADLILSYGHSQTMQTLLSSSTRSSDETTNDGTSKQTKSYLPSVYQSVLMSATLTADVTTLKSLVLRDPVILTLTEEEAKDSRSLLSQYVLKVDNDAEKFLHIYVILKLKLIKGKAILFVNDVERCYRLKLFLEQFSIRCCVLNRELPINSRYHTIQEFNKGIYDYIIATDESGARNEEVDSDSDQAMDEGNQDPDLDEFVQTQREAEPQQEAPSSPLAGKKRKHIEVEDEDIKMEFEGEIADAKKQLKGSKKPTKKVKAEEKEYSTSRGVDFLDVACVVNFDLPLSSRSYVHRVGRTARAGRGGVAISFVVTTDYKIKGGKSHLEETKIWRRIERDQNGWSKDVYSLPAEDKPQSCIKDFTLSPNLLAGFRYRMQDALRSVTGKAVKEARIKELKNEILNSGKLKAHFEDHPLDLEYLRHDKPLHPARIQSHMKYVPSYLLPKGAVATTSTTSATGAPHEGIGRYDGAIAAGVVGDTSGAIEGFVPFNKHSHPRGRGRGRGSSIRRGGPSARGKRKNDPLRKFGA